MDLSVIKDQLSHFASFVDAINGLIDNFPKALQGLGGLFDGKLELFDTTDKYHESAKAVAAEVKELRSK